MSNQLGLADPGVSEQAEDLMVTDFQPPVDRLERSVLLWAPFHQRDLAAQFAP